MAEGPLMDTLPPDRALPLRLARHIAEPQAKQAPLEILPDVVQIIDTENRPTEYAVPTVAWGELVMEKADVSRRHFPYPCVEKLKIGRLIKPESDSP